MLQALIYQDEDGVWVAEVPSMPGCHSQGASRDEAIRNITEAASLWLQTAREAGDTRPPPRSNLELVSIKTAA